MKQTCIDTESGPYYFQPKVMVRGVKKINKEQSKQNLFDFKKVMDQHNLKFGLIYGTLLGAVREKDFITHDEDIDLFMLEEDRNSFLNALADLKAVGLDVVRYDGKMISLMKEEDYIDVYFFKKGFLCYRTCGKMILNKKFLSFVDQIDFLGKQFWTVKDPMHFLKNMYGKNWHIPIQNKHAKPYVGGSRLRHWIRKYI